MRTSVLVLVLVAVCSAGAAVARAAPSTLCVGSKPTCFATLQAALAAAHDGDTIKIAAGTWAGGVTIDKSVTVQGAGAAKTTISGGGPVVAVGVDAAASQPTVTIRGVTITGGVTNTDPVLDDTAPPGAVANGGGIQIERGPDWTGGATLTLVDSDVTGNRAYPTTAAVVPADPPPPDWYPQCPGGPCTFAITEGGGIWNAGTLTLIGTTVSDNQAGSVSGLGSIAIGGGIETAAGGTLTLDGSTVSGNVAAAGGSHGWLAQGGGLFMEGGAVSLTVRNSVIGGNHLDMVSTIPFPYPITNQGSDQIGVLAGGIFSGTPVTIDHSRIERNSVSASSAVDGTGAWDAGMWVEGAPLVLRDSTVSGNTVEDHSVGGGDGCGPVGGTLEAQGNAAITNTQITGNTTTIAATVGWAAALGAVLLDGDGPAVIRDSVIGGNTTTATSLTGTACMQGAGITSGEMLDLRNVRVTDNVGAAHAPTGWAQGAGIWNGWGGPLTMEHSRIDHNTLTGDAGIPLQGGGLYSCGSPYTLSHSQITANDPDQVAACPSPLTPFRASVPEFHPRNADNLELMLSLR